MQKKHPAQSVLIELNSILSFSDNENTKSPVTFTRDKIEKYLMLTLVFVIAILAILGIIEKFTTEFPRAIYFVKVAIIYLTTLLIPITYILINTFLIVFKGTDIKNEKFKKLQLKFDHDQSNVDVLMKYKKETLIEVKDWLIVECSSVRKQIDWCFGNPYNVALISLAGLGLTVLKEIFPEKLSDNLPHFSNIGVQDIVLYIIVFFTGALFSAIHLKRQLKRYAYQIEILEMAIKRKSQCNPPIYSIV